MRVGEISKEKRNFGFGRKVDDDGSQAAIVLWGIRCSQYVDFRDSAV